MSLKDLFKNRESFKHSSLKNTDDVAREVEESSEFIEQFQKDRDRFIPPVDYRNPANFARYGLAEKYYEDSIKRIYETYPYDGSLREVLAWHNSSSYIDKYIFENEYPRTNGYAVFAAGGWGTLQGSQVGGYGAPASANYEYILIKGGPNTGSSMASVKTGFSGSNLYDAESNRQSNLEFNLSEGVTVEFWLKKDTYLTSSTEKEVIFDLWNGENSSSISYGRLRVEINGKSTSSPFLITALSGTSGFYQQSIGANLTTSSLEDWGHYAFTFSSGSSNISASLYVDGDLNESKQIGSVSINEVTGALRAHIAALIEAPSGSEGALESIVAGAGKLSASLDEFRFWKTRRTSQEIGRNWFTNVYGGTNTDLEKYSSRHPVDLGVYFKFNEGITTVNSTDSIVLDYSGRYTNGTWTGYGSSSRNVGSAIVSASAASKEFKDPIIYSFHPDVDQYLTQKKKIGSAHDFQNNAALYNMLPRWVLDDDARQAGHIRHLTQIIASYFDSLHLQIQSLSTLREATYSTYPSSSLSSSAKPLPFANMLLEGLGLDTPELFIDSEIIEKLTSRDEERNFEEELHDIKNLIYHNIYNNLAYVYKSKGTEKSFRNLIRCFGIDDELVRFNIYGQNALFKLKDNYRSTVVNKNVIDFNHTDRFGANVYQYSTGTELGYINGSTHLKDFPCTVEAEIIFPRKKHEREEAFFTTSFVSSSLFGLHEAGTSSSETTWGTGDNANFQVYAVRTGSHEGDYNSRDAYFVLTSSNPHPFTRITSSVYSDVYDNSKWNFAVRLKHDKHTQNNSVLGTMYGDRTYSVEFYGVNTILGEVINEFTVSSSVNTQMAENFVEANKRLYVGAHRTNFTGTLLQKTDIKASSLRFWFSYVDNDTVKAHAKDSTNLGLKNPYRNLSLFHTGANHVYIPSFESLALNWDFETVTGSAAGGTSGTGDFTVSDFSSGSVTAANRYGKLGEVTKRKHPGRGDFFVANSTASVENNYYHIAKQQLPEFIFSDDMVNIVDQDDPTFTRESRPTQFYFSAEKSMYQTISEEMINMFATIVDFNNLIGEPVHRYRPEYKEMGKLRQMFFERIENTPNLDKYIDFYKWIDHSITTILMQMSPASANMSENLRNMIENHILERSKYRNKFPSLKSRKSTENLFAVPNKRDIPFQPMSPKDKLSFAEVVVGEAPSDRQVTEVGGWKFNHEGRINPASQKVNSAWWKYRAERNHPQITSGDVNVDKDRTKILSASSPYISSRGGAGSVGFQASTPIHGGVNFPKNKILRYAHQATTEFGPTTVFSVGPLSATASNNFVIFRNKDVEGFFDSLDAPIPAELNKKKWRVTAFNNSDVVAPDSYDYNVLKGTLAIPFNLHKHNVVLSGGYHATINTDFKRGVDFTNLHVDTYGPSNEVPMQGPFTQKHVGGLQYRHVELNKHDTTKSTTSKLDEQSTRPEGWFLLLGSLDTGEKSVGIVGPTYTTTDQHDKDTPRARLYRGLTAKSPVNIANIRTTGSILGNYSSSIEYLMTTGRLENNAYFKENSGVSLPPRYAVILPKTTNVHTLIAITADDASEGGTGNYFGVTIDGGEALIGSRFVEQNETEANIFTLPRRDLTGSNSVIASRFAAPGGPEVMSRGFLDIISEERSVYNALPFRNLSVRGSASGEAGTIRSIILPGAGRDGLRTLLTRHQGQFGIDSQHGATRVADYATVGSFHKVNKNVLKRIEYSNEAVGAAGITTTASVFNNYWIQNPIPRSDLQYGWFTASFVSYPARVQTFGHAPADGLVSSSVEGVVAAYNFVSASEVTNNSSVTVAFAAHNTYLVDGVVSDQNLLSASIFPSGYVSGLGGVTNIPEAVHGITLQRHGPYGYPSWKQTRANENQVARYQRRNNILSITTQPEKIFESDTFGIVKPQIREGVLNQFTEPPVTSKHKPLVHVLKTNDESSISKNSGLRYTHANNKSLFPTSRLNFLLDLKNTTRQVYDNISDLYLNAKSKTNKKELDFLLYRETIFPRTQNTFLKDTRSRTTFVYPEWESNRQARKRSSALNSINQTVASQSIWPLDARNDFATATVISPGTGSGTGELQNLYTIFHDGKNLGASSVSTKSVRFSARAYLTASSGHSSGILNRDYTKDTTISMWFKTSARHGGSGTPAVSSSMIVKGVKDKAPAYEIRFHQRGITANVGLPRGSANEISAGDVLNNGTAESFTDDTWRNVVLTWGAGKMRLYVTGTLVGSSSLGTAAATASNLVIFGAKPPVATGPSGSALLGFKGYMDEISFFSGSMTDAQVTTLFNSGNPIDVPNTTFTGLNLLSHYRMGEHTNDGPLGKQTGFIQDVTAGGISAMTGNLSASVTNVARSGFSADGYGIVTDAPYNPSAGGNTNIFGAVYNRQVPDRDQKGTESGIFTGDVLWEAASQAGKEPFYDSYDDYREEFRGFAKDYSIIPEFRISEHMEYYIETKKGDFLADNKDFLQLTGATANRTSSAETGFFKTYTNTDFMKLFDVIKKEHDNAGHNPTRLTLQCNGVIKFTPYKGFYPASRTLQLATLFSKSFGDNLAHKDDSATTTADSFGTQVSFRTFLAPMLAPGVLYNSIKSGLAVDYPIMTSSFSVAQPSFDIENNISSSFRISSSFGYRLPFEALIQPENFLGGVTIVDQEPHSSASINSTASYVGGGGPLFELGMNNFIAEVPRFFLRNNGVTSLVSAKDDNRKYFKADGEKEYRMRVALRNTNKKRRQLEKDFPRDNSGGQSLSLSGSEITNPLITMYSRRSAFGPPVAADFIDYGESFEPFTPPYMDGYSDVELLFKPTETRFYFIDEIVSNLTSSFFRVGEQYFTSGSGATSPAFTNQMHITASVNLLDIARTKKATFDPTSGQVISVEDDSAAGNVAIIQTKWECPMLDFSNVSVTSPAFGSGSTRGMWHQYGVEPSIDKGVFLEIQDLTEEELTDSNLTGSLADLMGFDKSPVKLGQVLEEKSVREAVVAIPFVENKNGKKQFFNVDQAHIAESLNILGGRPTVTAKPPGRSIIEMVEKMENYVFPPRFDFITNKTVTPVVMYIFEFEHTFSKQDLTDMWQNLPPEIGRKFETKSATVSHEILDNELMGGKFKDSLRWMVFKVKQKASDNYFEMLKTSAQREGFEFDDIDRGFTKERAKYNYSYNWPYDYFSLVEMVKMDAEIKIKNKLDKE